jgi:hypothetical protein
MVLARLACFYSPRWRVLLNDSQARIVVTHCA